MLAKVRIAPVERWCKRALRDGGVIPKVRELLVSRGFAVIHTETMEQGRHCRFWRVAEPDAREVLTLADLMPADDKPEAYICEHMVEID